MFWAFAPTIRSTRPRLAAKGILSYLQMGGGVKSRRVGRVCGASAPHTRPDNSAVLVVPNVKIRLEAQHSIYPPNHHDLLWESCTFIPIRNFMTLSILIILESFTIAVFTVIKVWN
jgi:hypothetical protein